MSRDAKNLPALLLGGLNHLYHCDEEVPVNELVPPDGNDSQTAPRKEDHCQSVEEERSSQKSKYPGEQVRAATVHEQRQLVDMQTHEQEMLANNDGCSPDASILCNDRDA